MPVNSVPTSLERCPLALLHQPVGHGTCRASANISASVCSAAATALPPGALTTTMPRAVAARHVDGVHAGAGPPDDAQLRRTGEQVGVDARLAANDQRLGLGQLRVLAERTTRASEHAALLAEQVEPFLRDAVCDDHQRLQVQCTPAPLAAWWLRGSCGRTLTPVRWGQASRT